MRNVFLATAATLLATASPAFAVDVGDDPAQFWLEQSITTIAGLPPTAARRRAMVNIAMFDAINIAAGRPYKGYLPVYGPAGDVRAAASKAAHDMLVHVNPGGAAGYAAQLEASLALVADGTAKTNGLAAGTAAAQAMIAARMNDGSTAFVPYVPSGLPGRYAPTPPGNVPPVIPHWGKVTPFLMASGDQFRPGPPPALASDEYTAAYNEVKEIGRIDSATRTADQTASALFWANGPASWNVSALSIAQARGLSTVESARLFAMVAAGEADGTISVFDAKYHYDYWRPVTAIRAGDADGNDATAADAAWSSLIFAPPHPSYSSGHSIAAATATSIFAGAFGDAQPLCVTGGAGTRCFDSFSATALDAANSRLWGGIHWRFDNDAALASGRGIGSLVLSARAFQAVPEPASWALMIGGFAVVGAALRRRPLGRGRAAMVAV